MLLRTLIRRSWPAPTIAIGSMRSIQLATQAYSPEVCGTPAVPVQSFTLAVVKAGTGTGTMTSSPAGINCTANCSGTFNSGTAVTLTAAPAAGSVFAGWSGTGCGTPVR